MKEITLTAFFLGIVSAFTAYAEPPIEVIFWKASDVQAPSKTELERLENIMAETQSFFAAEMERYGFGPQTFAFNEIKVVAGKRKLHQYKSYEAIEKESNLIEWGLDNQIYVVFLAKAGEINGANGVSQKLCANIPEHLQYCNNLIVIPTESRHITRPLVAHEIGHAFGLDHTEFIENNLKWKLDHGAWIFDELDVMIHPLPVRPAAHTTPMTFKEFVFSRKDAAILNSGGRLSVQTEPDTLTTIDTDVNDDGYTDLSDCLIVKSAITYPSNYDTDVNNDGETNQIDLMLVKAAAHQAIAAAAPSLRKKKVSTWAELKR